MAKNDQQEAYEKLLASSLARAIDFVKFGEAKNAALLTFSSAWILSSVTLLFGGLPLHAGVWRSAFSIAMPMFILAALVSVVSFLPRTSLSRFHRDPERQKALLYFGDAAEFSPSSYRDRMHERYLPPEGQSATQSYLDDLAIQTNVNSSIALRKFTFFKIGATIVLLAIATLAFPAVINAYDIVLSLASSLNTKP